MNAYCVLVKLYSLIIMYCTCCAELFFQVKVMSNRNIVNGEYNVKQREIKVEERNVGMYYNSMI